MLFFLMMSNFLFVSANLRCSSHESSLTPKYHLLKKCHRSKLGVAAKANFSTLMSCQRLAIEKNSLAFNFSPPVYLTVDEKRLEYTCEVLKCAESEGGLSLVNDTNYDYYSIYAKYLPNVNSTCVPLAGMFYILSQKFNYTEAETRCKNMSAVLAGVFSEQRTDTLAQVLATSGVESAYVGLRSNNGSVFRSTYGESLDCITYRAWAPGHPKRNTNMSCVVLTRKHTWKTTLCQKRYPALCELLPNGPYRKGTIFPKRVDGMASLVCKPRVSSNSSLHKKIFDELRNYGFTLRYRYHRLRYFLVSSSAVFIFEAAVTYYQMGKTSVLEITDVNKIIVHWSIKI